MCMCVYMLFSCSVMSDSLQPPWTIAYKGPLPVGFSRQEYWSWLPFSSPGNLPNAGIEPTTSALAGDSLSLSHLESPRTCMLLLLLSHFSRV